MVHPPLNPSPALWTSMKPKPHWQYHHQHINMALIANANRYINLNRGAGAGGWRCQIDVNDRRNFPLLNENAQFSKQSVRWRFAIVFFLLFFVGALWRSWDSLRHPIVTQLQFQWVSDAAEYFIICVWFVCKMVYGNFTVKWLWQLLNVFGLAGIMLWILILVSKWYGLWFGGVGVEW